MLSTTERRPNTDQSGAGLGVPRGQPAWGDVPPHSKELSLF
ncbi:MAG: hypothetical protein ABI698_04845 [bacterium]